MFIRDEEIAIHRLKGAALENFIRDAAELGFQLVRTCGHVEPQYKATFLDERIARDRSFNLIARQDVEAEPELFGHLVLPLLDQTARRDDEAAFEVAPDQEFLNKQSCHDGLTGAWIVGEQEAQRLTRKHFAINGRDLVRQRLDLGRPDGEIRIEKVCESDAI